MNCHHQIEKSKQGLKFEQIEPFNHSSRSHFFLPYDDIEYREEKGDSNSNIQFYSFFSFSFVSLPWVSENVDEKRSVILFFPSTNSISSKKFIPVTPFCSGKCNIYLFMFLLCYLLFLSSSKFVFSLFFGEER